LCLVAFSYLNALNSLLQYGLIQSLKLDAFLRRINGLWTAHNVAGNALGALLLGTMGAFMRPAISASRFGFGTAACGILLAFTLNGLRQVRLSKPEVKSISG